MDQSKISYNPVAAIHIGSAVAAILLFYIVEKCNESKLKTIIEQDVQFALGFSDVEFYSALKTLREIGYMQSKKIKGGARQYTPVEGLLSDEIRGQ